MMITMAQFSDAASCSMEAAKTWHPVIMSAAEEHNITSSIRMAGFIAQMAVECARFRNFVESLNYSVQGLAKTWPNHFAVDTPDPADPNKTVKTPNSLAWRLGRTATQPCDQAAVANIVYGGRYGNKPGTSDGWKYRGRGPKQITFHDNYRDCGVALGVDLVENPELLLSPIYGARSAGWYWESRHCNEMMDAGDYRGVTKAINGGFNGWEDRVAQLGVAKKALGI